MILENFSAIKIVTNLFTNETRPGFVMGLSRRIFLICKAIQMCGNLIYVFPSACREISRDDEVQQWGFGNETNRVNTIGRFLSIRFLLLLNG